MGPLRIVSARHRRYNTPVRQHYFTYTKIRMHYLPIIELERAKYRQNLLQYILREAKYNNTTLISIRYIIYSSIPVDFMSSLLPTAIND